MVNTETMLMKHQRISDWYCTSAMFLLFFTSYFVRFVTNKSAFLNLICGFFLLVLTWRYCRTFSADLTYYKTLKVFWAYAVIIGIYSLFSAQSFVDYRYIFCSYFPAFICILASFWARSVISIRSMWRIYFVVLLPLAYGIFIHDILTTRPNGMNDFPHVTNLGFVFLLTLPNLSHRIRIVLVATIIVAFFYDTRIRINIVITAEVLLLAFLSLLHLSGRMYKMMLFVILLLPVLFVGLGVSGVFNINRMSSEADISLLYYNAQDEYNFFGDSRSSIWEDARQVLLEEKKIYLGLTPAHSYTSVVMGNELLYGSDIGRRDCEIGFLTFLYWGGIPLMVLWTVLFWQASWFAVTRSRNVFCRFLGLFVALFWGNSFLEIEPLFSANTFFLYFLVGVCLNIDFLTLDDFQMKHFWKNLFLYKESEMLLEKNDE